MTITGGRPLEGLLQKFQSAALVHYSATLEGDHRVANRNAAIIERTYRDIIAFGAEGRGALLRLIEDPEKPVALTAAAFSIHHSPAQCEKVIRQIAKDRELIGFIAQQSLKRWIAGELNFD